MPYLKSIIGSVLFLTLATARYWPATAAGSPPPSDGATKDAEEIYTTRCANCHGSIGKGDGPAAPAIKPKPQDFTDKAWQKKVTDAEIEKAIVLGGESVGKSPFMIPNPDLSGKHEVVTALRVKVRSFGK